MAASRSAAVTVSRETDWLSGDRRFPGELRLPDATTIVRVRSRTQLKDRCRFDTRYFIASADLTAEQAAKAVRGHWLIENSLHWTLDVVFKDDQSRLRKGHGALNMAIVRHFAINLVRAVADKRSIKLRRKKAGWSPQLPRLNPRRTPALTGFGALANPLRSRKERAALPARAAHCDLIRVRDIRNAAAFNGLLSSRAPQAKLKCALGRKGGRYQLNLAAAFNSVVGSAINATSSPQELVSPPLPLTARFHRRFFIAPVQGVFFLSESGDVKHETFSSSSSRLSANAMGGICKRVGGSR